MGDYPGPSRGRQSSRCGAEQGEAGESESEETRGQSRGRSDGVMQLPTRRTGDRDGRQSLLQMVSAAAAKTLQSCLTVRPHRWQPTRLPWSWDSPSKNTGVGCHFLLQCLKVKSESEVAQSWPTLCDPTDYSLPGSTIHGIFQARIWEWVAISFSKRSS